MSKKRSKRGETMGVETKKEKKQLIFVCYLAYKQFDLSLPYQEHERYS